MRSARLTRGLYFSADSLQGVAVGIDVGRLFLLAISVFLDIGAGGAAAKPYCCWPMTESFVAVVLVQTHTVAWCTFHHSHPLLLVV